MKLQYSITQMADPNGSYILDFALEPNVPYLIIIGARYADTAFYVGIASIIGGYAHWTTFAESNLNVTLLTDGRIMISYDYEAGSQPLYINAIRLE